MSFKRARFRIPLIALITSANLHSVIAQQTKPAQARSVTIPLYRGRDRLFAKAIIDGTDIGFLDIDTGATSTGIDADIALRFNWPRIGRRWINTQEGNKIVQVALID